MEAVTCIVWGFVWLICGAIAASIMKSKGRSAGLGWVLGIGLAVIGVLIAAVLPKNEEGLANEKLSSGDYRECVACKEVIKKDATICPHCRTPQTSLAGTKLPDGSKYCVSCSAILHPEAVICPHCHTEQ